MFNRPAILALFVVLISAVIFSLFRGHRLRKIMPPSPPGLPVLGNILQLPRLNPWIQFTDWRYQYGPIYSLNVAGQAVIVLNSFDTVTDLLDRRSSIYSDRPRSIMAGEILGGGIILAFMGYGERWRRLRRIAFGGFTVRASVDYQPMQEREAARLVAHLLRDPMQYDDHFKRNAASTVLTALYDRPLVDSTIDQVARDINEVAKSLSNAGAVGAYLVDIFPAMLYLPEWLARWKREGRQLHEKYSAMLEGFLRDVQNRLQTGDLERCLGASLIEAEDRNELSKREAAWLAGIMFVAGSETTSSALSVLLLAMTLYPDVLKRGQDEIDAVVGIDRQPGFQDQNDLPYINAIVKEVLRWRPIAPLGVPRRCMQDDWYQGYFIPKGAIIVQNTWAMSHDPAYFPDADEFRPERFLGGNGKSAEFTPQTNTQNHFPFGSGRRICAGMNLAYQSLFINTTCLLWALNIQKPLDENGEPIVPSGTCIDEGLVVRPSVFKCAIEPRFLGVLELLGEI